MPNNYVSCSPPESGQGQNWIKGILLYGQVHTVNIYREYIAVGIQKLDWNSGICLIFELSVDQMASEFQTKLVWYSNGSVTSGLKF